MVVVEGINVLHHVKGEGNMSYPFVGANSGRAVNVCINWYRCLRLLVKFALLAIAPGDVCFDRSDFRYLLLSLVLVTSSWPFHSSSGPSRGRLASRCGAVFDLWFSDAWWPLYKSMKKQGLHIRCHGGNDDSNRPDMGNKYNANVSDRVFNLLHWRWR